MCKSKNWRRILSRPAGAGAGSGEGSRPSYQLALVLPLVAAGTADDADDRRADDQHDGDAARQHVQGADDDDRRVVGTWRGLTPIGIQLR